jgi:hypothetical protein
MSSTRLPIQPLVTPVDRVSSTRELCSLSETLRNTPLSTVHHLRPLHAIIQVTRLSLYSFMGYKSCSYLPQKQQTSSAFTPSHLHLPLLLTTPPPPQLHDAVLRHLRCPSRRVHCVRLSQRRPRRCAGDRKAGVVLDPGLRRGALPCSLPEGLVLRLVLHFQVSYV